MQATSVIFHHPGPICDQGASGSQVRPRRMLEAFRELGCRVSVVAGYADARRQGIRAIKDAARRGERFDLLYSESSTMPTLLTERHHLPVAPLLDFPFIGWARSQGVRTSLFYRDVYWRFELYRRQVEWYKRAVSVPLYRYDWFWYRRTLDYLFLPSWKMKPFLPSAWPQDALGILPPGFSDFGQAASDLTAPTRKLRLLYVGGVVPPLYDMTPLFQAVERLEHVQLTVCCRQSEWQAWRASYPALGADRLQVVHASGAALEEYYNQADLFVMVRDHHPYLDLAMPVKVAEALGYGVPMVTLAGTEAARFVQREGIGWVVSDLRELHGLLTRLAADRQAIRQKRRHVQQVRHNHTWRSRAQAVVATLAALRPRHRGARAAA